MSIITFISDFGTTDHYVASVKASILKYNPNNQVIDLSHEIKKYDISHAAYVFKNVFSEFPVNSVHIIAVNNSENNSEIILFQLYNQFIITYDSGIISLIDSNENINAIKLDGKMHSSFPEKFMGEVASKLASGINYTTLGSPLKDFRQYLDREVRIQRNQIIGHSIRIDNYGNIITNISKSDFYNILSKNNGNFEINLGVDKILNISESYNDVGIADLFALFNYNDNLEIGMNKGNASNLLGIKNHTPITINFL
jgi:S-adenosyl-L-methionine hydrolase (adenosine-forming)